MPFPWGQKGRATSPAKVDLAAQGQLNKSILRFLQSKLSGCKMFLLFPEPKRDQSTYSWAGKSLGVAESHRLAKQEEFTGQERGQRAGNLLPWGGEGEEPG
jgi:hypothetical protein